MGGVIRVPMPRRWERALYRPSARLVWAFLADFTESRGFAPSYRQIAAACSIGKSSVAAQLDLLAQAGIIEWWPGQPRSVRVLHRLPVVPAGHRVEYVIS